MALTKNFEIISKKFDSSVKYSIDKAVDKAKELKFSNFDESLDIAVCLGVDPRHADQNIRVSTTLPHGTGKTVRVLVIAEGEKEKYVLKKTELFMRNAGSFRLRKKCLLRISRQYMMR